MNYIESFDQGIDEGLDRTINREKTIEDKVVILYAGIENEYSLSVSRYNKWICV